MDGDELRKPLNASGPSPSTYNWDPRRFHRSRDLTWCTIGGACSRSGRHRRMMQPRSSRLSRRTCLQEPIRCRKDVGRRQKDRLVRGWSGVVTWVFLIALSPCQNLSIK